MASYTYETYETDWTPVNPSYSSGGTYHMTQYKNGEPITITEGYTLRDVLIACLVGLIAGFFIALGVFAYVGYQTWCPR